MKANKSIKLKAAILLTVFALNTVVAFACSLGFKMGYNNQHHHKEETVQNTAGHSHSHSHNRSLHHHENASGSHHNKKSNSGKDDCCTDNAIKFQKEDKKLQQPENIAVKAPVFIEFMSAFLGIEIKSNKLFSADKSIIPQFYPPPDIRIAIQSFQI